MASARGARRAGRRAGVTAGGALVLLGAVALGGSRGGAAGERGAWGSVYGDGPPPGHTGGFGEPTCARCHFDAPVNPTEARLEVRGYPDGFVRDSAYRLTVLVTAPALERAGFEMAVRCLGGEEGGRQAGRLAARDDRAEVLAGGGEAFTGDSTVLYARHTLEGSRPTAPDTATWGLTWTASEACPTAVLHAAANAANGDDSEFGDRILTGTWKVRAGGEGRRP